MTNDDYIRKVVAWASLTIQKYGKLYSVGNGEWDILTQDGWLTANNWRELSKIANDLHKRNAYKA